MGRILSRVKRELGETIPPAEFCFVAFHLISPP
jgi:hypothetical protein